MKKILVCANSEIDGITEFITEKIIARGIGARVYFPFRPVGDFKYKDLVITSPELEAKTADMLICLGGDGTILSCSKLAARANIPILGINYGHKGFIAALEPNEISSLDEILSGNFKTEDRMMLSAEVIRDGKTVFSDFGLNEAVVRSASSHPARIAVFGDGVEISAFSGDGVIAATPTGSTAYSMSAGGPIVEPNAKNFIITPICAHTLSARTVVLMGERRVSVKIECPNGARALISVDGGAGFELDIGDEIIITASNSVTRLVSVTGRSFYDIVKRKLNTFS